jgi:parvulin-like peptidyl-prolyl isomerase
MNVDVLPLTIEAQRLLANHGLLRPLLRQVLIAEAVSDQVLSHEQRQQALLGFAQQRGLDSQEALQRFAQAQLLSPQALSEQVELPLRLQQHCGQHFSAKAEARFLERKQQLDQVVYSLLRVPSEGLARELYLQLQDGEANFSDLAARYSEGPEKGSGGIVGPVPLGQGHPLLVQRMRTAAAGGLLEPFQIEHWWLVVRLESLRPAIFDEQMALQMSQELFEQWLEQQVDQEIQRLRPLVLDHTSEASR